jgi:hypothetical protein
MPYMLLALIALPAIGYGIWKLFSLKGPGVVIVAIIALIIALGIDLTSNASGHRGMPASIFVASGIGILLAIAAVNQGFVTLITSKNPRSLLWFAATAVIFVLQLIPYTGLFLMFLMAPFWSVITVNAGFAHLAAEAYFGKIHKVWLILPIAWFAGYEAAALLSHRAAWQLDAQLKAENSRQTLNFNDIEQSLVFEQGSDFLSGAAQTIFNKYDVSAAYERNPNFPGYSHLVYRENVRAPEDPTKSIVLVKGTDELISGYLLPYRRYTISLLDHGTPIRTLFAGHAHPLSWIPLPIMGCSLNSAAPSWDCVVQFWRDNIGLGGTGGYGGAAIEVVATALGLKPRNWLRDQR